MLFQICSDLHLEFPNNRAWISENPLIPKADILIIAGDTYYLDRDWTEFEFIRRISKDFKHTYIIPGNHEYYGGYDVSTGLGQRQVEILPNVTLLNNTSLDIDGVRLIFSTMWSKINRNMLAIMRGMNDFRLINYLDHKFNINDYNLLHEKAWSFLEKEIAKPGKKLVITHHLPSELCNAEEHKGSELNEAFCIDKTRFIENNDIDYWVYGHSHRNTPEFEIGGTKMVTNQLGYVGWDEHLDFKREFLIQL
ncbi:MAG: metallophosphoesterase [Bacteroidota bacterium]